MKEEEENYKEEWKNESKIEREKEGMEVVSIKENKKRKAKDEERWRRMKEEEENYKDERMNAK